MIFSHIVTNCLVSFFAYFTSTSAPKQGTSLKSSKMYQIHKHLCHQGSVVKEQHVMWLTKRCEMQVICITIAFTLLLEIKKVKNKHIPRLCFLYNKHSTGESDFLGNISCLKIRYHWYLSSLEPSELTGHCNNMHLNLGKH